MKNLFLCLFPVLITFQAAAQNYTGPIIDMHVHAYTLESAGEMFGRNFSNPLKNEIYKAVNTPVEQRIETFKMFEKHNIVKAVTSDGHLWHKYDPDRILISERSMPIDTLRKLYNEGILKALGEMTAFYGGVTADHPSQRPYFDLAEELDIPIGYHVLPGGPPGGIYFMGMDKVRVNNANPKQLEEVLVSHPKVRLYVMHGGWPYLEDMKAMMYAHPQLYIDVAVINWVLPKAEFHDFLKGLINAGFGNRIMFGSDQMTMPETIGIGIDAINSANFLTLKQKEDIFYNNAARFLGLSKEEIERHHKR